MKKILFIVILLVGMVSLAACSTADDNTTNTATNKEQLAAEKALAEQKVAEEAAEKAKADIQLADELATKASAEKVLAEKALAEAQTELEKIEAQKAATEAQNAENAALEAKVLAEKAAADTKITALIAAEETARKVAAEAAEKAIQNLKASEAATKVNLDLKAPVTTAKKTKITMVWLPNESGGDFSGVRDVFGDFVTQATGLPVEHKLTTDYLIAVEAMANNNADLAFLGAQAYVEANSKNKAVQSLFVNTGPSGTLLDAVYYAWLAVNKSDEAAYQSGGKYTIDNIAGKKFSWVSTSSTSGFKVPSAGIVSHFSKMDKYKTLKADDLLEGGSNKFFSDVLFGVSHQGSAVNLLTGRSQVSSFCDACVDSYVQLSSGTANRQGAVYKVRPDASEPFNNVTGKEFTIIQVTPVLNAPFVVNTNNLSKELTDKILAKFISDEARNNPAIFAPTGYSSKTFFKKTKNEHFVPAPDSWFNPIRELNK